MIRLLLLGSSYIILASCSGGKEGNTAAADADTAAEHVPAPPKEAAARVEAYKQTIVGTWESEDDRNPPLIITPDKYVTTYRNEAPDSASYALGLSSCTGESSGSAVYLYVDYDHCYTVEQLDRDRLTLTYMGRGSSLVYRRRK